MPLENSRLEVIMKQYKTMRHEVLELKRGGNLHAAIVKARKAVDFLEQQQDGLAYLIEAANDLAALYGATGDWSSAEPIFEQCRYVREKVCGPKDKDTATALMLLGVAKYSLRKYSDAEALLQASLALREELFGSSHPAVAVALMNLAAVYKKTGRSIDAKKLWDRAERIGLPESFKQAQTEGNGAAPLGDLRLERIALNLDVHGVEEIPGKSVVLHGAEYIFHNMKAEGDASCVFPVENCRSGLVIFGIKVFKCTPGAPEYEDRKKRTYRLQAAKRPTVYAEFYDIPGGLIRLRRLFDPATFIMSDAMHAELMEKAVELIKQEKFVESLSVLEEVLRLNPAHTDAMMAMALCYERLGQPLDVLRLMEDAIAIEPNDPDLYRQEAGAWVALRQPLRAIALLDRALARYRWDFKTWDMKKHIAADFCLVSTLDEMAAEAHDLSRQYAWQREVAEELSALRAQASSIESVRTAAMAQQTNSAWKEASALWDQVASGSQIDVAAKINMSICQFHIGMTQEIAEEIGGLVPYLFSPYPKDTCALLAMLGYHAAGNIKVAAWFASYLDDTINHPWDLPTVPHLVGVGAEFVLGARSARAIIAVLAEIKQGLDEADERSAAIASLMNKYEAREVEAQHTASGAVASRAEAVSARKKAPDIAPGVSSQVSAPTAWFSRLVSYVKRIRV